MDSWPLTVTVRDLLALPDMADVPVVAHDDDLDRAVGDVRVLDRARLAAAPGEPPPNGAVGGLAVVDCADGGPGALAGTDVDVALRAAARERAHALVAVGAPRLAEATRVLALRLGVPLLVLPRARATSAISEMMLQVRSPRVRHAEVVCAVADRLGRAPREPTAVLDIVANALQGVVQLQSGSRIVHAARSRPHDPAADPGATTVPTVVPLGEVRAPFTDVINGRGTAVLPIRTPDPTSGQLVLVAANRRGGPAWRSMALDALTVAQHPVAAWLGFERLSEERRRHAASAVLDEIAAAGGQLSAQALALALQLGWQPRGWHLALFVRPVSDAPLDLGEMAALEEELRSAGLPVEGLVPRAGGAAGWMTAGSSDGLPTVAATVRGVRAAIAELTGRGEPGDVVVGVGSARSGADGLLRSIDDARRSALLASPYLDQDRVRAHSGHSVERVLASWSGDDLARREAAALLGPVAGTPSEETLRTYLDLMCSVSATATSLGVHRNTVMNRLRRVQDDLRLDLADPATRLALQLALRTAPSDRR
ncbi:PucR family transcriptional regulator [Streptomyces radicis]|uniref:PucR family transcriptional regulator n=1 Tax=Streptomyces radicis TaxID=1750517 RepID=A0A3A9W4R2_9ACTN|nr:helix-turn-helix domain-containing protein [Streptomyces radicis]RKN04234.1 PucR family transcriptional regulator [Streptomyces radicis]RKN14752.1 PucR family transcriptional regulator [Streptomyces radicis]